MAVQIRAMRPAMADTVKMKRIRDDCISLGMDPPTAVRAFMEQNNLDEVEIHEDGKTLILKTWQGDSDELTIQVSDIPIGTVELDVSTVW